MEEPINVSTEFREWLKSLILASRLELSNLTTGFDKKSFNLVDLSPPCQVIALWYGGNLVLQHVFVTKDPKRGDLDIIAVGPLGPKDMERQMSAILRLASLQVPLEPDDAFLHGVATYAEVLKEQFLRIAAAAPHLAQMPKHEGEAVVGVQMVFVYGGFTWMAMGELTSVEPTRMAKKLVNRVIEGIERDRNPQPLPPGLEVREYQVEGFGGRFLPRLWLGKKPVRSFEQRLANGFIREWTFFTCSYKERFVRVDDRSSIFIEGGGEQEALRLLNEIAGGLLLSGIPCFAFRPGMIHKSNYQSKRIGPNTYNSFGAPPITLDEARYFGTGGISEEQLKSYREVSKQQFLSILGKIEKNVDYEGKSDHLHAFVESYTDLVSANYKATFIGSWTIIENYCKTQWFISKKGTSFSRAYELAKKWKTSPEPVFHELDRLAHFDRPRAKDFSRLYEIRSKVAHSRMYTPTREEAIECYKEAELLVRRELTF